MSAYFSNSSRLRSAADPGDKCTCILCFFLFFLILSLFLFRLKTRCDTFFSLFCFFSSFFLFRLRTTCVATRTMDRETGAYTKDFFFFFPYFFFLFRLRTTCVTARTMDRAMGAYTKVHPRLAHILKSPLTSIYRGIHPFIEAVRMQLPRCIRA